MKHNFRFLVLLLLVVFAASGLASGADGETDIAEVLKLSLDDCVRLAQENNQQVKLAKLGLEKAELARSQYKYQDRKIVDFMRKQLDLETELGLETFDKQTQIGMDLATRGVDAALRGVKFGAEGSFYGAIFARDSLSIAEAALKRQEDMLRIAEVKLKAGTAAKKDVMDAKVQLAKAQAEAVKARSEKEKAYMNLKDLLGIDLDRDIELDYTFQSERPVTVPELDKLLEEAFKNRMDIAQAQGKYDLAELDFDYTKKAYPSITFAYKQKEHALLEAELNLDDVKIKVEKEIRGLLLDIQDAKTNLPLLEETVAFAKEGLRLAKLSYDAGMLRRVDVDAAEEGLKQAELQRAMVISNCNLTGLKLENVAYIATVGSM